MAPRDGQSRPERGHGVDCRQRRTNRASLFFYAHAAQLFVFRVFETQRRDRPAVEIAFSSLSLFSLRVLLLLRRRRRRLLRPFDVIIGDA